MQIALFVCLLPVTCVVLADCHACTAAGGTPCLRCFFFH